MLKRTTRAIQVWWYNREKPAMYEYASVELANDHYEAFKAQQSIKQVCLYDAEMNVLAVDGILNGRHSS